jgi:hypothetical protein
LDVEHFAKSRDRPKFSTIPSRTTLFPNTDFFVNVSTSRKLTEDELKGINDDRTMVVYVFGEVRYKDIFGKPHTTKFCSYYEPLANMFASCHQYNFAN